jgi:hypothetical protein
MTFEGWTNEETWLANLYVIELEDEIMDILHSNPREAISNKSLGQDIEKIFLTAIKATVPEEVLDSIIGDFTRQAIRKINWPEIADSYLEVFDGR